MKNKIKELFCEEEFELTSNQNNTYHNAHLTFYNKSKDVEIDVSIKKKNQEEFV